MPLRTLLAIARYHLTQGNVRQAQYCIHKYWMLRWYGPKHAKTLTTWIMGA